MLIGCDFQGVCGFLLLSMMACWRATLDYLWTVNSLPENPIQSECTYSLNFISESVIFTININSP